MNLALILLGIGNVLLLLGLRSLRTQKLRERHALFFVAIGVPFLALAVWPEAVGRVAARLGIEYRTVLLLAVTTFLLLMVFSLLSMVSVLERRVVTLAQHLALLSRRIEDLESAGGDRASAGEPLRVKPALRKGA